MQGGQGLGGTAGTEAGASGCLRAWVVGGNLLVGTADADVGSAKAANWPDRYPAPLHYQDVGRA